MTTDELHALPLFSGVSPAGLERLSACGTAVDAPAGQVLALADDPGSGMFVVLDGTVTVELRGAERVLGPGDFFGELALLTADGTRVARVRAASPVRLLSIPRAETLELLGSEPSLTLAMLREVSERLASFSRA